MHAVLAWMIGAGYISYKYGYKCGMLPMPKRYLALTGFVSIAALVGAANPMVGGLIAYGTLFGVFITQYNTQGKCDTLPNQSSQSGSQAAPKVNPTVGGSNAIVAPVNPATGQPYNR